MRLKTLYWTEDFLETIEIYDLKVARYTEVKPFGQCPWNMVYSIGHSRTTKIAQIMTLSWPLTFLRKDQLWVLMHLRFMEVWTQRVTCKVNDTEGRHVNIARDPLRSYLHEPQTTEIHLLHLHCFYIVFVHYFWNFDLNLEISGEEKL